MNAWKPLTDAPKDAGKEILVRWPQFESEGGGYAHEVIHWSARYLYWITLDDWEFSMTTGVEYMEIPE